MDSSLIACCEKKQTASYEEECGYEVEFKLLSNLPDQMLIEILIRLPKKCATMYKLVCRRWCSLISSSHFISRFINHCRQRYSTDTPDSFILVFQHELIAPSPYGTIKRLCPIEAVSESYIYKTINLNFLPRLTPKYEGTDPVAVYPKFEPIRVQASCHDLLLCSWWDIFYVVNLLTNQWIVLPTCLKGVNKNRMVVGCRAGLLCYHDSKHKNGDGCYRFKVLLVPLTSVYYSPENLQKRKTSGPPEIHYSKYNIEIYCSEARQWTKVLVDWYPLNLNVFLCYSPILSYGGMLHWLIGSSLVSLDLFNNDVNLSLSHVTKLPDEFFVRHSSVCFGVCMGLLRIACCVHEARSTPFIQVWELESGSWSLVNKVVLPKSLYSKCGTTPLAFHPYNRDVIFFKETYKIYLFDLRTGEINLYRELKLDKGCRGSGVSVKVVPPLLLQWFPTPVPSPQPVLDTY